VGLGDISPQSQLHRAATVVMLPFGLVCISFGISCATAYSKSLATAAANDDKPKAPEASQVGKGGGLAGKDSLTGDAPRAVGGYRTSWANSAGLRNIATLRGATWVSDFRGTTAYTLLVMVAKYFAVLGVGVAFFMLDGEERTLQMEAGVNMTVMRWCGG